MKKKKFFCRTAERFRIFQGHILAQFKLSWVGMGIQLRIFVDLCYGMRCSKCNGKLKIYSFGFFSFKKLKKCFLRRL